MAQVMTGYSKGNLAWYFKYTRESVRVWKEIKVQHEWALWCCGVWRSRDIVQRCDLLSFLEPKLWRKIKESHPDDTVASAKAEMYGWAIRQGKLTPESLLIILCIVNLPGSDERQTDEDFLFLVAATLAQTGWGRIALDLLLVSHGKNMLNLCCSSIPGASAWCIGIDECVGHDTAEGYLR